MIKSFTRYITLSYDVSLISGSKLLVLLYSCLVTQHKAESSNITTTDVPLYS